MRETKTARVALGDDGVLTVRVEPAAKQSIDNAKENLAAALATRDGKRRPLLIDIRGGQPLDAEVRHYYSGQILIDGFTALGLLVDASPLGRMMGNVYFRVARPGIPTRLFTDADEAAHWLREHIA
jgi:predicted pyridoxine 5'-phosphate oxidase superfamily flavin-nucleotide-binding protein